jgi:hypothetical protein
MSGRPDEIGEAGIGGLGHDDLGLDWNILLFRLGPMFPPVISNAESDEEHCSEDALEIFRKLHRRINPRDR